ncbi:MAG: hypothetical protein SFX74_07195 [Fimbriimonadaceae bacterium]|nr:hypothetical protein [Fimbriimonadaceae bacterium]
MHELGLADTPKSPKPVLRLAAEHDQLVGALEDWLGYADARVATSHDYSQEKATATLVVVGAFLRDCRATGIRWKRAI